MKKHLRRWRQPLIIPRWILMLKYLCFIGLGGAVWSASSPSLDLTTGDGYTALWGIIVICSATLCFVGSMADRLEWMERWAVLLLSALLLGFAAAPIQLVLAGDHDRLAYSVIALTLSLLPTARAVMLIGRVGKSA